MRRVLDDNRLAPLILPATDVYEAETEYVVELDVPGLEENEQLRSCSPPPFRAVPDGAPARPGHARETMSLTATARAIPGTLRQEVVIDGQHRLITDQPERVGGDGSGPSPHELFPAALAACVAATLVQYGRTKSWELGEVRVAVDYDHRSTPRKFDVLVELSGDLTDAQLERLARVARACPLRRSIEAGVDFAERIARRPREVDRELVEAVRAS